jgi:TonB family protein
MFGTMKILSKTLLAALLLASGAQGALPSFNGIESLGVDYQVLPLFPEELTRLGVREGEVRLVLSVDHLGNLEDTLVISSTHPKFTDATLGAFKKWRFKPLRQSGQPVAATAMVTVKFETRGAVVTSMSSQDAAMAFVMPMMRNADAYRMHTLRELDQIPTPIAAPGPAYPRELKDKGVTGEVNVGFYIDETGAVRIPSVDAGEDPRLASLAIEALRQWRFEPPRSKGVPVLVKASQAFKFGAPTKWAVGER